jgi:alkyl hydroperoxide reductase subunit AhpC
VDSEFSHFAWINTPRSEGGLGGINYPLVADKTKSIARDYGVLIEEDGVALRGLFLINPEGKIAYEVVQDLNVGRSVDETLRVLKAFKRSAETGDVCPANWDDGADTMTAGTHASKAYFKNHG